MKCDFFVWLAFWHVPADSTHCSCLSSLLAAYKLDETEKLLTFLKDSFKVQHIFVISRDILLISTCSVNEVKVRKLLIIASYTCNLFQNYFKGAKIWWFFAQLYQNPTDYFVLEVSTDRFQIRISIARQEKENKILCIANEEMGATTFS